MANKGKSEPGLFGSVNHYDEHGRKTGTSEPGLFGGYVHYDSKGKKVGTSEPGMFGGYVNYDSKGQKIGTSEPGLFGGYVHYDDKGHKTGSSEPGLLGSLSHNSSDNGKNDDGGVFGSGKSSEGGSGACYIATCVYGSYDCPPVWTLRRFRDNTLSGSFFGRLFIRFYYMAGPAAVRLFGKRKWFNRLFGRLIDRMVKRLNDKGVPDTPYSDDA